MVYRWDTTLFSAASRVTGAVCGRNSCDIEAPAPRLNGNFQCHGLTVNIALKAALACGVQRLPLIGLAVLMLAGLRRD
jgi:hypothetical protein